MSTAVDSPDLSDDEVDGAVDTHDFNQLAQLLARALAPEEASVGKGDARYVLAHHEIRRRAQHLYLRSFLECPGEPRRVLLHRIDWIESEPRKEVNASARPVGNRIRNV